MRRSTFIAALTSLSLCGGFAVAQDNKSPVRLLVGFSAGGSFDATARALADKLRVSLNQPVVVENKPGATQRLALGEIKRSKPDGLTLILANNAPFTIFPHIYKKLEFNPVKDFTPLGRIATYDLCIAAGPKAPPGGVPEFLAWAKEHPQEAAFGTGGTGQSAHFIGDMLSKRTGVPLMHVPYKGGSPALTELAGGQIPILIDTILESLEMSKSGKVRILATTGEARLSILPNVPTLRELGIDITAPAYLGIYGPPGMSQDKVQRISKALNEAMQSPDLQRRIVSFAMTPAYSSPAELEGIQADGLKRWEAPIKASGFTAD